MSFLNAQPAHLFPFESYEYTDFFYKDGFSTELSPIDSESSESLSQAANAQSYANALTAAYKGFNTLSKLKAINMKKPFNIIRKGQDEVLSVSKLSKKIKKVNNNDNILPNLANEYGISKVITSPEIKALKDPNIDMKWKNKINLMMRNRISAQQSRDRKKAYISNLEDENRRLRRENEDLLNELRQLKEAHCQIVNDKMQIESHYNIVAQKVPTNTCICSSNQNKMSFNEEKFEDFGGDYLDRYSPLPQKDYATRGFVKKPSLNFMGYSTLLLIMLICICFLQNKDDKTQKFKSMGSLHYYSQNNLQILDNPLNIAQTKPLDIELPCKTTINSCISYLPVENVAQNITKVEAIDHDEDISHKSMELMMIKSKINENISHQSLKNFLFLEEIPITTTLQLYQNKTI